MKSFAYTCKFCHKPGVVQADEAGLEFLNPEKWLPMICCDRCGKYMEEKRGVVSSLSKICRVLEICRNWKPEKRSEVESEAKRSLIHLTKKMAKIVCDYYRVTNIWEEDFAKMIFEQPGKLSAIIGAYIRGVASEARKPAELIPAV